MSLYPPPIIVPDADSATTFPGASEALESALQFESSTEVFYHYSVFPIFVGGERALDGFVCRVLDLDGFTVGYLKAEV